LVGVWKVKKDDAKETNADSKKIGSRFRRRGVLPQESNN